MTNVFYSKRGVVMVQSVVWPEYGGPKTVMPGQEFRIVGSRFSTLGSTIFRCLAEEVSAYEWSISSSHARRIE